MFLFFSPVFFFCVLYFTSAPSQLMSDHLSATLDFQAGIPQKSGRTAAFLCLLFSRLLSEKKRKSQERILGGDSKPPGTKHWRAQSEHVCPVSLRSVSRTGAARVCPSASYSEQNCFDCFICCVAHCNTHCLEKVQRTATH